MGLSGLRLHLLRLYRSIWFLPSGYAVGSVLVLALAPAFEGLVPSGLETLLTADALETILGILASSMLAVAIFSLGTMVSALEAAAQAATPRARVLLTQDRTAQTAISTFIGAFIFSILGIIGLSTGIYSNKSAACIFLVTIVIIAVVIVMLISWIKRLSEIGGVGEVVKLVEQAAQGSFAGLAAAPNYGGKACDEPPSGTHAVTLRRYGYLQLVNAGALGEFAQEKKMDLYLLVHPGALIGEGDAVLRAGKEPDDEELEALRSCFVVGDERTYEADPRFGLLALSEIGSRALSPAVNDPGTAIQALSALVRVLRFWREKSGDESAEPPFPRLHVVPFEESKVIEDAFRWMARDGAGYLEVGIKLQKALAEVKSLDADLLGPACEAMSREAIERAEQAPLFSQDLDMLKKERRDLGFSG
jgi:uncharacterized membrane protein